MEKTIKKSWKKNFYIVIFCLLVITLINDLNLTNLIKEKNLETYSMDLIEKNSKNDFSSAKLILNQDLNYSKLLIFETDSGYQSFYFSKGRLVNLYNYQMDYINSKPLNNGTISYDLSDSVYKYSFDIKISDDKTEFIPRLQDYNFDFSSIILLIIFVLAYLFLNLKKDKSLKTKKTT